MQKPVRLASMVEKYCPFHSGSESPPNCYGRQCTAWEPTDQQGQPVDDDDTKAEWGLCSAFPRSIISLSIPGQMPSPSDIIQQLEKGGPGGFPPGGMPG